MKWKTPRCLSQRSCALLPGPPGVEPGSGAARQQLSEPAAHVLSWAVETLL